MAQLYIKLKEEKHIMHTMWYPPKLECKQVLPSPKQILISCPLVNGHHASKYSIIQNIQLLATWHKQGDSLQLDITILNYYETDWACHRYKNSQNIQIMLMQGLELYLTLVAKIEGMNKLNTSDN